MPNTTDLIAKLRRLKPCDRLVMQMVDELERAQKLLAAKGVQVNQDEVDYLDNRSDPLKSAARYDEIVNLRMFLYDLADLLQGSEDNAAREARRRIIERTQTWGKKEDPA